MGLFGALGLIGCLHGQLLGRCYACSDSSSLAAPQHPSTKKF